MELRRKDDPTIMDIHSRLDKLESISADLSEIKEWIGTVVKVTRMFEITGNFLSRWAVIWLKITGAMGVAWVTVKYGISDLMSWLRSLVAK